MDVRIIRYENKYKEKLKGYIHKTHPLFSHAYVDYVVENASSEIDNHHSFLVVDSNDSIVGTHMLYNTQALICGKCVNTAWGHDTVLIGIKESMENDSVRTGSKVMISGFGVGLSWGGDYSFLCLD